MESDWKNSLSVDDKGNLTKSISNYRSIFTHDENLSQIRFDTFCQDDISFSPLFLNVNGNKVDEESVGKIQDYLEQTYQLRLTQNKVFELLKTTASERSYNPVQDFIRKEMWDGVPRIETAIIDYLIFRLGEMPHPIANDKSNRYGQSRENDYHYHIQSRVLFSWFIIH